MREPGQEIEELATKVIGAAIRVHTALGPAYREAVYQRALAVALRRAGLAYETEHQFEVLYEGECVGRGRLDFLVEKKLIIEVKAVTEIQPRHQAQVIQYLAATDLPLALLLNFSVARMKRGIKRIIRSTPHHKSSTSHAPTTNR